MTVFLLTFVVIDNMPFKSYIIRLLLIDYCYCNLGLMLMFGAFYT